MRPAAPRPRARRVPPGPPDGVLGRVDSRLGLGTNRVPDDERQIDDRDLQDQHHEDQFPGLTRHSRSVGNPQVTPTGPGSTLIKGVARRCERDGRLDAPRDEQEARDRGEAKLGRERDLDQQARRTRDANAHLPVGRSKLACERRGGRGRCRPRPRDRSRRPGTRRNRRRPNRFGGRAVTSAGGRPHGRSRTRARRSSRCPPGGARPAPRSAVGRRTSAPASPARAPAARRACSRSAGSRRSSFACASPRSTRLRAAPSRRRAPGRQGRRTAMRGTSHRHASMRSRRRRPVHPRRRPRTSPCGGCVPGGSRTSRARATADRIRAERKRFRSRR